MSCQPSFAARCGLWLLALSLFAAAGLASELRRPSFPSEPEIGDPALAPAGYRLVEGDMLFREDRLNKGGGFIIAPWSAGDVPYEWDANLSTARRDSVRAAMAILEAVADVDFHLRSSENDYIHIQWDGSATNSEVGQVGGRQLLRVADWATVWNIVHELLHALGFVHEHTRSDRETYVDIQWSQISQTACGGPCDSNFQIDGSSVRYGWYDFDSIMHYGQNAWAIGSSPTITTESAYSSWQTLMGQRTHLSDLDILTVSLLYPEADWRFVDDDAGLPELGLFLFPWDRFTEGMDYTPSGGTLWVQPGNYNGNGVYDQPITIRAPLGGVTID